MQRGGEYGEILAKGYKLSKMNKSQESNIKYGDYSQQYYIAYLKVAMRIKL